MSLLSNRVHTDALLSPSSEATFFFFFVFFFFFFFFFLFVCVCVFLFLFFFCFFVFFFLFFFFFFVFIFFFFFFCVFFCCVWVYGCVVVLWFCDSCFCVACGIFSSFYLFILVCNQQCNLNLTSIVCFCLYSSTSCRSRERTKRVIK